MEDEILKKLYELGRQGKDEEAKILILSQVKKQLDIGSALLLGSLMNRDSMTYAEELIPPHKSVKLITDDPRFHRLEKISPAEFFITVGRDEFKGNYYAVVMAPKGKGDVRWTDKCDDCRKGECEIHGPDYKIIATCRYGFSTPEEATTDAARQYPSLPVLSGTDQYQYPFYNVRKMRIIINAQKRREEKARKAQRNADRSEQGRIRTPNFVDAAFYASDGTVTDAELDKAKTPNASDRTGLIELTVALAKQIYEYSCNGSNCHIVLDDQNLESFWIQNVIDNGLTEGHREFNWFNSTPDQLEIERQCMHCMLTLSESDRQVVIDTLFPQTEYHVQDPATEGIQISTDKDGTTIIDVKMTGKID